MDVLLEWVIVDVSDVDWSDHPAWSSDFEATRLSTTPDRAAAWPGDIIEIRQRILKADGSVGVREVEPREAITHTARRVVGD